MKAPFLILILCFVIACQFGDRPEVEIASGVLEKIDTVTRYGQTDQLMLTFFSKDLNRTFIAYRPLDEGWAKGQQYLFMIPR